MMIFLFSFLLYFPIILATNQKVVSCPSQDTTLLASEEYIRFESFNYPVKARSNNLKCFQVFKISPENSYSKIWFVFLNGELESFKILGKGAFDMKIVKWDKHPLWFSHLVNFNEMAFDINENMPENINWKGFQAFIYATNDKRPSTCPLNGQIFDFSNYLDIIAISSSYYFPNKNEYEYMKACKWQFNVVKDYMLKFDIKLLNLIDSETITVQIDDGKFILLRTAGVHYFDNRKVVIVFNRNISLTSDYGFGAIITLVESNPSIINTCQWTSSNDELGFINFNKDGYKNNELCEKEININEGQMLQLSYFGYLEDGVDKLVAIDHLNQTYDLAQNSNWIIDGNAGNVLFRFTSDGSLTKAGFLSQWNEPTCECSFKSRNSWPVNTMVYWDAMTNKKDSMFEKNTVGYCNNMKCSFELIFSESCSVFLLPKIKLRSNSNDSVKIFDNNQLIDDITPDIEYRNHFNLGFATSLRINFESDNLLLGIYPAPYVLFGTICLNNLVSSTIDLSIQNFTYTLDLSTIKVPKFITINVPKNYTLDLFLRAYLYILPSDKRLEQIYLYDSNTTKNFVSTFKELHRHEKYPEMQYYTATSSSLTLFIHASRASATAFFRIREIHAQNCISYDNVIPVANADVTATSISDGPCFLTLLHWSDSCESAQYFDVVTDSELYVKYFANTDPNIQFLEFNMNTIDSWSAIYFYGVANSFIIPASSYIKFKSSSFFGGKGPTTKEILVSEAFACPSFETTTIKSITIPFPIDIYSNYFCRLTIKFFDLSEFGSLHIYSKTKLKKITQVNQVFDFLSDTEDRKIFVHLNETVEGHRGYVIEYEMLTNGYNEEEITTTSISEISTTFESTELLDIQLTSSGSPSLTVVISTTLSSNSTLTRPTEKETLIATTFETLEATNLSTTLIPTSKETLKTTNLNYDIDRMGSTTLSSESSYTTSASSIKSFETDDNDLRPEQTTTTNPFGEVTTMEGGTKEPFENEESSVKWWWYVVGIFIVIIFLVIIATIWAREERSLIKLSLRKETTKRKIETPPFFENNFKENKRLKRRIDSKNVIINFNHILGKGANATVFKAFIKGEAKKEINQKGRRLSVQIFENYYVALKMPTSCNEEETDLFIRELDNLMSLGSHQNIITFIGWTHYNNVPCVITELANTDLLQYVKSFRGDPLPIKIMISILLQISQALEYVTSLKMIHRDVACRNILLTENNIAKLADFGLCCHCDDTFTYKASFQKRFPLKWLAIESLVDRLFSEKSDAWSFGILCYEIFSYGAVPYPTLSSDEMLEFLKSGKRLEKPNASTYEIYGLMLGCWRECPQYRPTFKEIGNRLRIILENETAEYGYLKLQNPSTPNEH